MQTRSQTQNPSNPTWIKVQPQVNNAIHVATYQLPVPLGDCSVHLLVGSSGKVESGFIMDGGKSGSSINAKAIILNGVGILKKRYGNNWRPLDTWVVTHWDEDHYRGMLDVLTSENFQKQESPRMFAERLNLYAGSTDIPPSVEASLQKHQNNLKISSSQMGKALLGKDLFGQSTDKDARYPRFICLGADGYVKGANTTPVPQNPSQNERSLLSLIWWPKSKRCSYYTGGDGNPKLETLHLIPAMKADPYRINGAHVTVMKLDHHGSAEEYGSGDVLKGLTPNKIIITPGHQYGHPCWDVIYHLHMTLIGDLVQLPKPNFLYSTRLPYWFGDKVVNKESLKDLYFQFTKTSRISKRIKDGWYPEEANPVFLKEFQEFQEEGLDYSSESDGGGDFTLRTGMEWDVRNYQGHDIRILNKTIAKKEKGPASKKATNALNKKKKERKEEKKKKDELKGKDEAELPDEFATIDDQHLLVYVLQGLWNDLCPQKVTDEMLTDEEMYYMLELISTDDNNRDGNINFVNWNELVSVEKV